MDHALARMAHGAQLSALADQAEDFLAARTWDATTRCWVHRPAGAPVLEAPAPTSTPAELFARAYRDEEAAIFGRLVDAGMHRDEAAAERWRARAGEGWSREEIAGVLGPLVDARLLRELAVRFEGLQAWGPIAPPRQPQPGARRLLEGCAWRGETWAPSTEGERWPVPRSDQWVRLRRASRGAMTKVFMPTTAGAWEPKKKGTKPPFWYTPEIITVADDVEAWAELLREWEHDHSALLVRGVLARNPTEEGMQRTMRGTEAYLAPHPVGRRVIVLDLDKIDPADVGFADWPGAARWPTADEGQRLVKMTVKARLPACFDGAAAAYRWSASAGVPRAGNPTGWARPSCHVVYVLDRPVHDESLELWLEGKADKSIAGSEHALYLSPPVFLGERPHWPEDFARVGVLDGAAEVVAPDDLHDGEEWELLCELAATEAHVDALQARRSALEAKRQRDAATRGLDARLQRTAHDGRPMTPLERARRWIAKREPAIEGQGGDLHTYITAATIVCDFDLSDADALEVMREWDATCRPPWGVDGLSAKIASARKNGGAKGSKIHGGYDAS